MKTEFVSKRAKIYADVPDEKWNDWRWQLSNRLNTAEDIEKVWKERAAAHAAAEANGNGIPAGKKAAAIAAH